jgi:hypothetical protein
MSISKNKRMQRAIFRANVEKLQRAGLIGPVDFRKKASPSTIRKLEKYRSVLVGKSATVQAPDLATARRLRKTLGLKGTGKTIVIPKEKGERYAYQKTTGEIVSKRKGYNKGETIKKTLSKGFPAQPEPGKHKRLYYTVPERTRGAGKLKRKTFGSFNELLYYISKYDVRFEDLEDHIEIEEINIGGQADKRRQKKIHDERATAIAKYKRNKRKTTAKKSKAARKSKKRGRK